jgi:DNA-binding LytR/AlgR family response regulator
MDTPVFTLDTTSFLRTHPGCIVARDKLAEIASLEKETYLDARI